MNIVSAVINITFLVLIILLVVKVIYVFFKKLISVCKNIKLFKYIFKPPFKKIDIAQIIGIIILVGLIIFEIWFFSGINNFTGCSDNVNTFRSGIKKCLSGINQAIQLNYAVESKVDADSVEDFAKMMARRMYVIASNSEEYNISQYHPKFKIIDKKDIKKYGLGKYADKPILQMGDGSIFMFEKFENKCAGIDEENPKNSDCIMVADVNGFREPNTMTTDGKKPSDRYYIYVLLNEQELKAVILDEAQQEVIFDGKINRNK